MSDTTNSRSDAANYELCDLCEQRAFDELFLNRNQSVSKRLAVANRGLQYIKSAAAHCNLCRLILAAIELESCSNDLQVNEGRHIWAHLVPFAEYRYSPLAHFPRRPYSGFISWIRSFSENVLGVITPTAQSEERVRGFCLQLGVPINDHGCHVLQNCIQLVSSVPSEEREAERIFKVRRIDPNRLDFNLIKKWLRSCETKHAKCWHSYSSLNLPPGSEFRLVDVVLGCLILAPQKIRYVALSYVWGTGQQLKLTQSNKLALFQPGYITRNLSSAQTISDTINICKSIGERYLWVDAMCIVQDSGIDKHAQIACMDQIFYNANLTIVASDGDVSSGIPGVSRSLPRLPTIVGQIGNAQLAVIPQSTHKLLSDSRWSTRAWTLQEQVLSRKMLVLNNRLAFFSCQSTTFREDTILESENGEVEFVNTAADGNRPIVQLKLWDLAPPTLFGTLDKIATSKKEEDKALQHYGNLVSVYYQRTLSWDHDVINAFTGILKIFAPMLGNFTFAIPSRYLYWALLWGTKDAFPIRRRRGFGLPSWTWAAWKDPNHEIKFPAFKPVGCYWTAVQFSVFTDILDFPLLEQACQSQASQQLHPRLATQFIPPVQYTLSTETRAQMTTPYLKYLLFWTSTAKFHVHRSPMQGTKNHFEVYSRHERVICSLHLDPSWRDTQPDQLEFIVLALRDDMLLTVLIEWKDHLAYRVQRVFEEISQTDWLEADAKQRFIILG